MEAATILRDNIAGQGSSVYKAPGGRISYTLPAPLGRWVANFGRMTGELLAVGSQGIIDEDVPFPCAPGLWSNASEEIVLVQSMPKCSGLCPAGSSAQCTPTTYYLLLTTYYLLLTTNVLPQEPNVAGPHIDPQLPTSVLPQKPSVAGPHINPQLPTNVLSQEPTVAGPPINPQLAGAARSASVAAQCQRAALPDDLATAPP